MSMISPSHARTQRETKIDIHKKKRQNKVVVDKYIGPPDACALHRILPPKKSDFGY